LVLTYRSDQSHQIARRASQPLRPARTGLLINRGAPNPTELGGFPTLPPLLHSQFALRPPFASRKCDATRRDGVPVTSAPATRPPSPSCRYAIARARSRITAFVPRVFASLQREDNRVNSTSAIAIASDVGGAQENGRRRRDVVGSGARRQRRSGKKERTGLLPLLSFSLSLSLSPIVRRKVSRYPRRCLWRTPSSPPLDGYRSALLARRTDGHLLICIWQLPTHTARYFRAPCIYTYDGSVTRIRARSRCYTARAPHTHTHIRTNSLMMRPDRDDRVLWFRQKNRSAGEL